MHRVHFIRLDYSAFVAESSPMSLSEFDIQRLAHLFIQLDGEQAMAKARKMVEETRRRGDHDGADKWLRIIVAIGELGEPPIKAHH